jgi:hypothetical protein
LWISEDCPLGSELPIEVAVSSYDRICWRDTFSITVSPVSIEEIRVKQINIYPNPANDLLNIQTDKINAYSIAVSSLSAHLLFSNEVKGSMHQLDLSIFREGVYFITIRSKDFMTTRKIVKL